MTGQPLWPKVHEAARGPAGHPPPSTPRHGAGDRSSLVMSIPVSALIALFLLTTSRWGSYITVPGLVFYVGDIALGLALVQSLLILAGRNRAKLRAIVDGPLVILLSIALVAFALARLFAGGDVSLVALRDAAPYAYALLAITSFVLPAGQHRSWRPVIYGALVFHLLWSVALPRIPGFPWFMPVLGADAQVFALRPDFDATVLGLGAAFALQDLLVRARGTSRREVLALAAFATASVAGMASISTRAGLLAGFCALATVALTARHRRKRRLSSGRRLAAAGVLLALLVGAIAFTPAGQRVSEGFGGGSAAGTVNARQQVWTRIGDYVLRSPERTAVGVGFGRDFIVESGSAAALEGEYQNVRSPHNYVVGTLARLGVGGAMAVCLIIFLGWWLAWTALRQRPAPMTLLAALVALSMPVVGLLGVVLESPFGALPYFWALGQLAAQMSGRVSETAKTPA